MAYEFNMDADLRDMIIFGEPYMEDRYMGGVRHFSCIDTETAHKLMDNGFLDPQEYQNCSPDVKDLVEVAEKYPEMYLFGYTVSPDRDDYRVSIEGLKGYKPFKSLEDAEDFIGLCRYADDFSIDPPYAWWD